MRSVVSGVVIAAVALGGVAVSQAQVPAGVARAAYTVEPFSPGSQITINGSGVRLRAEPFASPQTQVLSTGSTGLPLTVVGIARLPDWNWYQVILKSGQKAFIRSDYTSAPSKGGAAQPPSLPAPTQIDYGSASGLQSTPAVAPTPASPTGSQAPISLRPAPAAPAPAAPVASTPSYTAPTYTPPAYSAPVSAPAQPVAPAITRPVEQPISLRPAATPAPVPVQPAAPAASQNTNSAISLRPVSSMPTPATSSSTPTAPISGAPSPAFAGPAPLTPPSQTPGDLVPSTSRTSNSSGLTSN